MDIKTLVLALALGNLSLCAALFFFEQQQSTSGAAAGSARTATWSRAKLFQAVAWTLLYLRGTLPDFLTIPFANALLFTGFALDASALWEQAGRRVWRRYLVPVLAAAIAIFVSAWLLDKPAPERIAITSVVMGFFFVASAACCRWRCPTVGAG